MPRKPEKRKELIEFGKACRKIRQENLGISQEKFAEKLGVHPTYYSDIERGQRNPTLTTILRLCDALGVRPGKVIDSVRLRSAR